MSCYSFIEVEVNFYIPNQNSFVGTLTCLFPNVKHARQRFGQVLNAVYDGINLKPLANGNDEHLVFEDILRLKPSNLILTAKTTDKMFSKIVHTLILDSLL